MCYSSAKFKLSIYCYNYWRYWDTCSKGCFIDGATLFYFNNNVGYGGGDGYHGRNYICKTVSSNGIYKICKGTWEDGVGCVDQDDGATCTTDKHCKNRCIGNICSAK